MKEHAKRLVEQFNRFNQDMVAFVETCSEEDWKKATGNS